MIRTLFILGIPFPLCIVDGVHKEANSHVLDLLMEQQKTTIECTKGISALMSLREKISRDLGEVRTQVTELKEQMDALNQVTSLDDLKAHQQHLAKGRQKLPKDL